MKQNFLILAFIALNKRTCSVCEDNLGKVMT